MREGKGLSKQAVGIDRVAVGGGERKRKEKGWWRKEGVRKGRD